MAARNIYPAHGQDEYMAMRTARFNEAARVAASKPLTGIEFAQKKAAEALVRLASAATAEPEAQKRLAAVAPEKPAEADKKPLDFFVANFANCAIKDDQASMEAPMLSLATKPDMKPWRWVSADGKKNVLVEPSSIGRATMHDKDILIYCMSQIIAAINAGQPYSKLVRFTAYDYLTSTNRSTRGDDYDRFKDALKRLRGTQITTNIETNKTRAASGFGFIDSWKIIEKSKKDARMVAVEIELPRWLYNAIEAREVLTINPEYFKLRKPLERRLYEIARKHLGKQESWEIGIEALRDKCGSTTAALRNWQIDLRKIIEADTLPDYLMQLQEKKVLFKPRPRPI